MALDECYFTIDMTGYILPSDMKGASGTEQKPPSSGMVWYGGNEIQYRQSIISSKWNDILNSYDIVGLNRFRKAEMFYEICHSIAFIRDFSTNIIYYL